MKKLQLPITLLSLFFSILFISWTNPPGNEELEFPYRFYEYNSDISLYNAINSATVEDVDDNIANLGRVLFYDKILSSDKSSSCASCHKQEFSFGDNKDFSEGIKGILSKRNTSNLNDAGWQPSQGFFWDFNSFKLTDAVLLPILNPDELGLEFDELIQKMEATDYYPPLFEYAYEEEEISKEKIAIAIAEFIKSMNTFNSKYDDPLGQFGGISGNANLGKLIFEDNCAACHTAPHFGTPKSRSPYFNGFILNNGLDSVYSDLGTGTLTIFDIIFPSSNFYGVFKTPTLRNLSYTAPYMHDGRFETLEEVVEFYSTGIKVNPLSFGGIYYGSEVDTLNGNRGFLYTEEEKNSMITFLKLLDDPNLITNEKWSDPFLEEPIKIIDEDIAYNIFAAPNPIQETATINISNSKMENYNLNLFSMDGKLIRQDKTEGGTYTFNRNNLPSGIYYLQITKDELKHSLKLLFQ